MAAGAVLAAAAAGRAGHRDPTGAVLAFDFGLARIGVAVGDCALAIAHPLDTIAFEDNRRRFQAIEALVREWQPVRMVVGLPCHADGGAHRLEPAVRRFAARLGGRFGVPVDLVDESLSSWEASAGLAEAGVHGRAREPHVDRMAARVILETWFGERRQP